MELQKPKNSMVQQNHLLARWFPQNFHQFINENNSALLSKKYFTELDLISDYAQLLCQFCLDMLSHERPFKFNANKEEADEECHVLHIRLMVGTLQFTWKILFIQMDKVIKVDIRALDAQTNKYLTLDSFWFNYSIYLNPKISNTYKMVSLKEMNSTKTNRWTQLNYLFISRILQSFAQKIPEIPIEVKSQFQDEQTKIQNIKMITHFDNLRFFNPCKFPNLGKIFCDALGASQNFIQICAFLNIKSIVTLKQVSRFMRNYLFFSQKTFFKSLYEYSYGKTGFDIDQMDWKHLLNKKRAEKNKQKNQQNQNQQLVIGRGIFRTH